MQQNREWEGYIEAISLQYVCVSDFLSLCEALRRYTRPDGRKVGDTHVDIIWKRRYEGRDQTEADQ